MTPPSLPLISAFRRPAVIAAIGLLLVNDHVLKAVAPSWITGKLSDFAGLFFFPLLLGALIELAAAWFKRKAHWALPFALGFTGLLFVAIKTLPAANALYTSTLGVQVVRDPSDLLALVMLLPAWWVGRQGSGYAQRAPGKVAYAALALGALASMATSPCMPGPSIMRLVLEQGNLYAGGSRFPNGTYSTDYLEVFHYTGQDSWQPFIEPGPVIYERFASPPPELPYTLCDPVNVQHCYRIDGTARVDETTDGGQTWQTAWEIPNTRAVFMKRQPQPGTCGKVPELRTYDIVVLPDGMVAVAAGNEGLVMRKPGEEWQRVGIEDYVYPTPIRAGDLGEASSAINREFIYASVLSLLVYTVLSIQARRGTPRPGWALHPGWFVLPWLLAGLALWVIILEHNSPSPILTALIFLAALPAVGLMFLIMGVSVFSEPESVRWRAGRWALFTVFSALAVPTMVFLLWAYGVIAQYRLAAVLAVILTTAAEVILIRQWRRAVISA